jgi:hypothetical protein
VKLLLANDNVDPDSKDYIDQTPLLRAAKRGYERMVELLLAKDSVNPDCRDTEHSRSPLSWAAENGHEAVVKLLLAENGVDPDSNDIEHSRTPLSWAAENGHEAVVKLLLAKDGVDPNSKDNEHGLTPLSWAAEKEHPAVVRLLVEKEFSINANGQALLETALAESYMPVVELLLEWLLELKDAGFEVADIVPLLFEGMNKSSWLAFEQPNVDMSKGKVNVHFHQPSCPHNGRSTDRKDDPLFDPVTFHLKRDAMQGSVAAFCGLAGVFPPLRDPNEEQWCQQGGQGHFWSFALPALRN